MLAVLSLVEIHGSQQLTSPNECTLQTDTLSYSVSASMGCLLNPLPRVVVFEAADPSPLLQIS